uniref:Uncharacterized protein n=1 Tax=Vibrio vulnificus TaxID=672 RepID=A0A6S4Q268_VIBVL|nr:hypothetical protein [Vibrio vulnificus]
MKISISSSIAHFLIQKRPIIRKQLALAIKLSDIHSLIKR